MTRQKNADSSQLEKEIKMWKNKANIQTVKPEIWFTKYNIKI